MEAKIWSLGTAIPEDRRIRVVSVSGIDVQCGAFKPALYCKYDIPCDRRLQGGHEEGMEGKESLVLTGSGAAAAFPPLTARVPGSSVVMSMVT